MNTPRHEVRTMVTGTTRARMSQPGRAAPRLTYLPRRKVATKKAM